MLNYHSCKLLNTEIQTDIINQLQESGAINHIHANYIYEIGKTAIEKEVSGIFRFHSPLKTRAQQFAASLSYNYLKTHIMEKTIEMLSIESNNLLAIQNIPIGLKIETSQNPIHDILLDFKAKKEKNKKRTSPIKSSHNTKRSSNSSKAQKPAPKIDKRYDENEDNISLNQESSMKPPPFIPNSEESEQTLTLSEIEQSDFTLSILQQAIDNSHQAEANDTNKKSEKKKKTNKKNKNTKSQKPKQVNKPEKEQVAINDMLPLLKTEENSQNPPSLLPESPHSSELQTTEVIHKIRYATPEEIAEGKTTTYTYEYISTDSTDSKDDQNQINYQQDLDLQTAPIIDKDNENQFVEEEASENSLQKSLDLSDDIELSSNLNQDMHYLWDHHFRKYHNQIPLLKV